MTVVMLRGRDNGLDPFLLREILPLALSEPEAKIEI